ncbi:hypothetical protein BGX21_011299 [Mortierella sp. AD011]|nr:hypothetical protein BGX20_007937 [Mortierella sp. AD010]KAF9391153.1 hypothetical protein BGX21_011299 [Mortierella sp. AD011]
MSAPAPGPVRSQDNPSHIERENTTSTNNSHRYPATSIYPQTTFLLSAQESTTFSPSSHYNGNSDGGNGGCDSTPQDVVIDCSATGMNDIDNNSSPSPSHGFMNSSPPQVATSLISSTSDGAPAEIKPRPQRTLPMKHRLRRISNYYEEQRKYQQQLLQQQSLSKSLPPLPSSDIPKRRGSGTKGDSLGNKNRTSQFGSRSYSEPNTEDMDTSLLLSDLPGTDVDGPDTRPARAGTGLSSHTPAAALDSNENSETAPQQDHNEQDLFPYNARKQNWDALLEIQQQSEGSGEGAGAAAEGVEPEVMLSKWVNVLVVVLNLLAMTHLGKAVGACLEELIPKLGIPLVSVFDVLTSSSVELAVAAFALANGMVRVVQAAMLGAILNNLLLIMGVSLCVGGYKNGKQQKIQPETSQTGMNLLMIVSISYVFPVALEYTLTDLRAATLPNTLNATALAHETEVIKEVVDRQIWTISKIMALILLILYGLCLLFQYRLQHFLVKPGAEHAEEHVIHKRHVRYWFAGWGFAVMLAAQIYSSKQLVHSVESLGKQFELNDSFVGFILLPIVLVSDLPEEVNAIRDGCANKLDHTVASMIGSCMQIALLVTPLLVLLGWAIDVHLTLRLTVLEASILAGSVLIVNYLIQDNETNWLEGSMLLVAFFMCVMAFYYDVIPFETEGGVNQGGEGGG